MMMIIPDASVNGVDIHGKYFNSCDSISSHTIMIIIMMMMKLPTNDNNVIAA